MYLWHQSTKTDFAFATTCSKTTVRRSVDESVQLLVERLRIYLSSSQVCALVAGKESGRRVEKNLDSECGKSRTSVAEKKQKYKCFFGKVRVTTVIWVIASLYMLTACIGLFSAWRLYGEAPKVATFDLISGSVRLILACLTVYGLKTEKVAPLRAFAFIQALTAFFFARLAAINIFAHFNAKWFLDTYGQNEFLKEGLLFVSRVIIDEGTFWDPWEQVFLCESVCLGLAIGFSILASIFIWVTWVSQRLEKKNLG
ncbi:hypothetical protein L596_023620 [Steinernema carpocapsae]|uniref:Uncharacterized protein n=1 Tax=Steinernema carpocapsae TaxID=34508 RepID=A0A4U5ME83_STECR|nr:hypothetical protein L596_023620 [Steinernema carpocapsae]